MKMKHTLVLLSGITLFANLALGEPKTKDKSLEEANTPKEKSEETQKKQNCFVKQDNKNIFELEDRFNDKGSPFNDYDPWDD